MVKYIRNIEKGLFEKKKITLSEKKILNMRENLFLLKRQLKRARVFLSKIW